MNCSTLDFKQAPDVGVELEDSTAVQLQQDLTWERKWLSVLMQCPHGYKVPVQDDGGQLSADCV